MLLYEPLLFVNNAAAGFLHQVWFWILLFSPVTVWLFVIKAILTFVSCILSMFDR